MSLAKHGSRHWSLAYETDRARTPLCAVRAVTTRRINSRVACLDYFSITYRPANTGLLGVEPQAGEEQHSDAALAWVLGSRSDR